MRNLFNTGYLSLQNFLFFFEKFLNQSNLIIISLNTCSKFQN